MLERQTVQSLGTAIAKATYHLRVLFGVFLAKRSERYEGANPIRDLKTTNNSGAYGKPA